MTTTPTPVELAMARAILAEMFPLPLDAELRAEWEANQHGAWRAAVRYALAAEKARPVGEVPEGWAFVRDELHRMSLVIESAVREAEPEHHPLVLRLIKANTHLVRSAAPSPPEGLGGET